MKESIISNQIGRSGTSISAHIHEAPYAQGKKDFISKLEIALKEASETGYWLELLYRTTYIDEHTFKKGGSFLYKSLAGFIEKSRDMQHWVWYHNVIKSCKGGGKNERNVLRERLSGLR